MLTSSSFWKGRTKGSLHAEERWVHSKISRPFKADGIPRGWLSSWPHSTFVRERRQVTKTSPDSVSYLEHGSFKAQYSAAGVRHNWWGEVDATCASPAAFPTKLGDATAALIQKTTLPACPGRTDKVITRGSLLKAAADNKNEGMWTLISKETATCWKPLSGRGAGTV